MGPVPPHSVALLHIEDDPAHLLLVESLLEEAAETHFRLSTAVTLAQAHEQIAARKFDIILADLNLPDSQGLATVASLHAAAAETPLIVLSALADRAMAVMAVQAGAEDYLVKGEFGGRELLRALYYAIERHRANERLRDSEQTLAATWENSRDAMALSDSAGTVIKANPAYLELYGFSAAEVVGQNFAIIFPPDQYESANLGYRQAFAGPENSQPIEAVVRRGDGTVRVVDSRYSFITQGGQRVAMLSTIRDITARKRTEDDLRSREELFRIMFANNPLPMWLFDPASLRFLEVNAAAIAHYGYTREQFMAMVMADVCLPEDMPRLEALLATTGDGGRSVGRWHHRTASGQLIDVQQTTYSFDLGAKAVMLVVAEDISEQVRGEALARQLAEIVASSSDAIIGKTLDGTIVSWNPAAERIYGYRADEVIGGNVSLLIPPSQPGELEWILGQLRNGIPLRAYESRRVTKDGRVIDVSLSIAPIQNESGEIVGGAAIARDITMLRQAEEMRRTIEQAEAASRAKSEFLSRMSHELRTPLNAILGFGQLLEPNISDPEDSESVRHILNAGRHLLDLINEVLDITGIEAGRTIFSLEDLDVDQLLREAVEMIQPSAASSNIAVSLDLPGDAEWAVLADRQRIKQVLLNLLSNACKYNQRGGTIHVGYRAIGEDRLRITIEDSGLGIASEMLPRLFTPFERLAAAASGVEGTGLGLAISKQLVQAMGGRIGAESKVGAGSTFWIELPARAQPQQDAARQDGTGGQQRPDSAPHKHVVLYVEDNQASAQLMRRIMHFRPNIELLLSPTGLGADIARQRRVDLILLDLHLPDLSGEDVLLMLRSDPITRDIPLVILSADASKETVNHLRQLGVYEYLTKPVDVGQLLRVLDDVLGVPDGAAP